MGTGGIASAMAGTLRVVGSEPLVVGSARPGAADEFAELHGVAHTVDSYHAVAEFSGVDVVYVATTNDRHLDNVLACIAAGVPALCEKPLALNAPHGTQMREAAKAAGVVVIEAMWMRFQPFMPKLEGASRFGSDRRAPPH